MGLSRKKWIMMMNVGSTPNQCKYHATHICALTVEETNRVSFLKSAKEMWEQIEVTHEGTIQVKQNKIKMLLHEYELFNMKEGELITSMLDRFSKITNGLSSLGRHMDDNEKVKKILSSLPQE